jgi:hypothetical protein
MQLYVFCSTTLPPTSRLRRSPQSPWTQHISVNVTPYTVPPLWTTWPTLSPPHNIFEYSCRPTPKNCISLNQIENSGHYNPSDFDTTFDDVQRATQTKTRYTTIGSFQLQEFSLNNITSSTTSSRCSPQNSDRKWETFSVRLEYYGLIWI